MNVIFLSVNDVRNSEYVREDNKNLLKTKFGIADTIALCGRLEGAESTRYGPRLWINDGDKFPVVIGTFNKNVRKDAEQILDEFKKGGEMFVLVYGNPYETDKVYINVNHENSVIVVDKDIYEKFHEMRKLAEQYLARKSGIVEKRIEVKTEEMKISGEISDSDLINLIKKEDKGNGIRIDEFLKLFEKTSRESIEEKIYQLIESGELYEPKAGFVRVIE